MPEAPVSQPDPLIGRTFGDYEILARLGGGSMGLVYRARHVRLNSIRALKFLPPQWCHDEDAKERFRREAQAASAAEHPHICPVHDVCETPDGQVFIVMAFCEGGTLKARLAAGPLDVARALDLAAQIASALGKAHTQGVVHRDVKPGNVMLTEDGARLVDFGLATFADALQLTMAGTRIGTPAYMSPEQIRGERADARSDVWAAGVVLYEMLTGSLPFGSRPGASQEHAIQHVAPPPIRAVRPEVAEHVEHVVFRALHKDPAVRYQDGRELVLALQRARGLPTPQDSALHLPPRPSPPAARTRTRPVRHLWRAAAVLAAAGAVTLAWIWWWPVERTRVLILPFANDTGQADLDAYRPVLTQATTLALRDSPVVSAQSYRRLHESLSRYAGGTLPSGAGAWRDAIAGVEGALVLAPAILRDGGAWRVRIDARRPGEADPIWRLDTAPVVSSLELDTPYQLAVGVAAQIESRLQPRRMRARAALARLVGASPDPGPAITRSLEAARAFEEGIRHYEDLEYAAAHDALTRAVQADPRNPWILAWLSRTAQVLRLDDEATGAADRALAALGTSPSRGDAAFVEAVAAEARRTPDDAETHYRTRAARRPDDVDAQLDLAAFLDRRGRAREAADLYERIRAADRGMIRPTLELCRLKGPSWLNEPAGARQYGEAALDGYRARGSRGGEAQALLCLADVLRLGTRADRDTAQAHAERARRLFGELGFTYNLARAEFYLALLAGIGGRPRESAERNQQALALATSSGNTPLEPLILINLGVTSQGLDQRSAAAEYFTRAYTIYQNWREEARAAQAQANRGANLIDSGSLAEGYRDVRNALAVFQKLGDKAFEAFCRRLAAAYFRHEGRHEQALREVAAGLTIARERRLTDPLALLTISGALSEFELGRYVSARDHLREALRTESRQSAEARVHLARTHARLGETAAAAEELDRAAAAFVAMRPGIESPLLSLVRGEVALESGDRLGARPHFARAASLWRESDPDAYAAEARGRMGWLDVTDGRIDASRAHLQACVSMAARLGEFALQARCRVWLAEAALAARRLPDAAAMLTAAGVQDDGQTLGPELAAELQLSRARLLTAQGQSQAAARALADARAYVRTVADALSSPLREAYLSRPSIQVLDPR